MSDLRQNLQQKEDATELRRPELLAPAGSFDAMRAAINAGADAVYMGGSRFGARAYAENPDEEGIIKSIEFCHLRGKKLYMTVNTLFKEEELYDCLFEFIKPYYEAGLDAVIVQDIGVMKFISDNFKGLPIHVSTQATVTTAEGANSLLTRGYNITRVVPARELSLKELKKLRKDTELEIEVFSHGALCYCYSGQCLLSSMAGGRSGNRGRCAQPCRRMYQAVDENGDKPAKGYFLSPKDMCTLPYIHEMIEAGIDSFKIEGRMKSPEYCAGVVSVYRKYIDEYFKLGAEKYREKYVGSKELDFAVDTLRELYNRGGFNNSYLFQHNGPDMMSMDRPNHSGIEVGRVIGVSGRKSEILLNRDVNKGDVLEIRGENGKSVYEYTVADTILRGSKTSVITMKERLAEKGLTVYRTKNAILLDGLRSDYIEKDSKVKVNMTLKAYKGQALELMCEQADKVAADTENDKKNSECRICAYAVGAVVEEAKNAPITEDKLIKQLSKLGETDFEINNVSIEGDKDIFVPVGELNKIRREVIDSLIRKILEAGKEKSYIIVNECCKNVEKQAENNMAVDDVQCGKFTKGNNDVLLSECNGYELVASVQTVEQLEQVLKSRGVTDVYFNISSFDFGKADRVVKLVSEKNGQVNLYFGLPFICRTTISDKLKEFCDRYKEYGFIARNNESVALLDSIGAKYRTDYNMYAMNSCAAAELATGFTFPPEITIREMQDTEYGTCRSNGDFIVYGLQPVMVSAQCIHKNVTGACMAEKTENNDNGKRISLSDEKGFTFPSKQFCGFCYNVIYNSAVTNILDKPADIRSADCKRLRVDFTFETSYEVRMVLENVTGISEADDDISSSYSYDMPNEIMGMKYTNGHYFKWVE